MTTTTPTDAELRELLHREYKFLDWKWNAVFWVTAIFIVGAAGDITKLLFAGDWDFWTDWKDLQWWPVITPFAIIIIGSALQYIQWLAWRFPTGMVYTAVCMWIFAAIGRWWQWGSFLNFPMNYVWPMTMVAAAVVADWILLKTKSFVITSVVGAFAFTIVWWMGNYTMMAPFLQQAEWMDRTVTVADVQGIHYVHSQTPEYLRIIEHGSLRTFLGETTYVALSFGGVLAIAGYWIGQFIARLFAIWPIGKFMKAW